MPPSLHLVKKTLYILGKRCYNKNMQNGKKRFYKMKGEPQHETYRSKGLCRCQP